MTVYIVAKYVGKGYHDLATAVAFTDHGMAQKESEDRQKDNPGDYWDVYEFEPTEPAIVPNPFNDWKKLHHSELKSYRGLYVAIHLEKGIVSADFELKKVIAEVRRKQLLGRVLMEYIK